MGSGAPSSAPGIFMVEDADDVSDLVVTQPENLAYTTQTRFGRHTLEVIAGCAASFLRSRARSTRKSAYATQNRQDAVRRRAADSDLGYVVGSDNSSNSTPARTG